MTLHYEVSEAEIILGNQELAKTPEGKRLWQRVRCIRIMLGWLLGALAWMSVSLSLALFPLFLLSGAVLLGMVLDPLLRQWDIRVAVQRLVRASKGKGILGGRRLTLDTEGVTVVSTTGSQTVYWSALEQVLETPGFLLLKKTEHDYILLPKRAFSSPQHQTAFLGAIEHYRSPQGQTHPTSEPLRQAWYQSKDQVG